MLNQGVENPNFWQILPKYGIYDVTTRNKNGSTGKIEQHIQILRLLNR